MKRIPTFAVLSLSVGLCLPASSQEARTASHVYEAYYRIAFADLDAWNDAYFEHSVPILEELQEEGIIEGFGQMQHHTGGHYNIRFVARTYDWGSIETFWDEYLSRMGERAPLDELERMIVEHRDEIWNIGEVNVPDGFEPGYIYAAQFGVSFADMESWNTTWSDIMGDFVAEAAEEGTTVGWVRLDHNTGGPHNSKHLYLFEDWDDIDDFVFGRVLATLEEEQPELSQRLMATFDFHDDVVWVPTTPD